MVFQKDFEVVDLNDNHILVPCNIEKKGLL